MGQLSLPETLSVFGGHAWEASGSEDRAHVTDANAGAQNKSTKSIRTKFLVGTGSKRQFP